MPVAVLARRVPASQTHTLGRSKVRLLLPRRGPSFACAAGSVKGTLMHELRLVAVSEDGSYAVLAVPGRSGRFALPIDEPLRTVARGQFSRLAQYEIEVESPLRPKEIQDRIRAGETAEEIADAAGVPVDRIRRFEGPPLAERARWAQEARRASIRGVPDSSPARRLGEVVSRRLADAGADDQEAEWDSRRRPDGLWQLQLAYTIGGRMHVAEWLFDPKGNHVTADNDEAARLCLDEAAWPPAGPVATATVTPIGPRVAAHHGEQRDDDRVAGRGMTNPSRQAVPDVAHAAEPRPAPARRPVPVSRAAASGIPATSAQAPAAHLAPSPPAAGRPPAAESAAAAERARAAAEEAAAEEAAPAAEVVAAAGEETPAASEHSRPARRTGGRARRSSVPSWDEIMFGTSRQPD